MKRTLAAMLTLALALPLLAEEAKKGEEKPKAQPDSPLVAAARRANRLGKKSTSKVITNATLKSSGANAHVTTTNNQASLDALINQAPPAPTPEMVAAQKAEQQRKIAAEEAAKKKQAEEKRATRVRSASENYEDDFLADNGTEVDPAQAEKQMHDANATPKQTEQKPPR